MRQRSLEIELDPVAFTAPHFDQWFGVWAMEPKAMESLLVLVQATNMPLHLEQVQASAGREAMSSAGGASGGGWWYRRDSEGVAIVSLEGTLQKHRQSMSRATSTVIARRELRAAGRDSEVGAVLLAIDSPGGTAAGTKEMADEVAAVSQVKPVYTHYSDMGASAAFWSGVFSTRATANQMGLIGSIGTYAVVQDLSAMAAKEGIKVHVISTGKHKGDGVPGTEISADMLADIQRIVDARNEVFLKAVSKGRGLSMDRVRELADGRVHPAQEAVGLGLIDGVQSFDEALAEAKSAAAKTLSGSSVRKGKTRMSQPATLQEIRAACPGAGESFLLSCLDSKKELDQAKDAWLQDLATELAATKEESEKVQGQLAELQTEHDKLKVEHEKLKAKKGVSTGVEPLGETGVGEEGASCGYWDKVAEYQEDGKTKPEAMRMVNRKFPELRAGMLAEVNS